MIIKNLNFNRDVEIIKLHKKILDYMSRNIVSYDFFIKNVINIIIAIQKL